MVTKDLKKGNGVRLWPVELHTQIDSHGVPSTAYQFTSKPLIPSPPCYSVLSCNRSSACSLFPPLPPPSLLFHLPPSNRSPYHVPSSICTLKLSTVQNEKQNKTKTSNYTKHALKETLTTTLVRFFLQSQLGGQQISLRSPRKPVSFPYKVHNAPQGRGEPQTRTFPSVSPCPPAAPLKTYTVHPVWAQHQVARRGLGE